MGQCQRYILTQAVKKDFQNKVLFLMGATVLTIDFVSRMWDYNYMADRISISYRDYWKNVITHHVKNTKELRKKIKELRSYDPLGPKRVVAVMPYYNSPMTAKDWREFSRIRDIVGTEHVLFRHVEGANHFGIVNPQRDKIWMPSF